MQTLPKKPTDKGPAERFTGDVWLDSIAPGEGSGIRAAIVRFAPGARTAWHSHSMGQTLYIVAGLGRGQGRGGEAFDMRPGDVVNIPANEWHWHGAAPGHFMTHLAMWASPREDDGATWGEHVTDEEYKG